MIIKLIHENQVICQVSTDRSMTIDQVAELAGVDLNAEDGGTPLYDFESIEMEVSS